MQIVIDIDENVYTKLFDNGIDVSTNDREHIETCIRKGAILPRWHGRLIDADALNFNADYNEPLISKFDFDHAPTIIEADKAESEVEDGNDN